MPQHLQVKIMFGDNSNEFNNFMYFIMILMHDDIEDVNFQS